MLLSCPVPLDTPATKRGISHRSSVQRITYEIKPEIFDEKRGNAALLIKNFGFYFQSKGDGFLQGTRPLASGTRPLAT